jgi:hypothetical protein
MTSWDKVAALAVEGQFISSTAGNKVMAVATGCGDGPAGLLETQLGAWCKPAFSLPT